MDYSAIAAALSFADVLFVLAHLAGVLMAVHVVRLGIRMLLEVVGGGADNIPDFSDLFYENAARDMPGSTFDRAAAYDDSGLDSSFDGVDDWQAEQEAQDLADYYASRGGAPGSSGPDMGGECHLCGGYGVLETYDDDGTEHSQTCPRCEGVGSV